MPMNETFRIPPARTPALVILGAIDLMLLAIVVRFALNLSEADAEGWVGLVVTLSVSVLFGWFFVQQAVSTVHISPTHLVLKVPLYGRRIALGDIQLADVRIMTEDESETWGLTWRTNGIGLPGYQVGWFRTRRQGKVLAARTGKEVVLIPTTKNYTVMVSVQDASAFVQRMHQVAIDTP